MPIKDCYQYGGKCVQNIPTSCKWQENDTTKSYCQRNKTWCKDNFFINKEGEVMNALNKSLVQMSRLQSYRQNDECSALKSTFDQQKQMQDKVMEEMKEMEATMNTAPIDRKTEADGGKDQEYDLQYIMFNEDETDSSSNEGVMLLRRFRNIRPHAATPHSQSDLQQQQPVLFTKDSIGTNAFGGASRISPVIRPHAATPHSQSNLQQQQTKHPLNEITILSKGTNIKIILYNNSGFRQICPDFSQSGNPLLDLQQQQRLRQICRRLFYSSIW